MPVVTFKPSGKSVTVNEGAGLVEAARRAGVGLETPCGGQGACGKCIVRIVSGEAPGDSRNRLSREKIDRGYVLACRTSVGTDDLVIDIVRTAGGESLYADDIDDGFERVESSLVPSAGDIRPLVETSVITVAEPNPGDGLSDVDRFLKGVQEHTGVGHVECPLEIVRTLAAALRQRNGEISLKFERREQSCRVVDVCAGNEPGLSWGIAVDVGTTTVAVALARLDNGRIVSVRSDYNRQIACGLDVIGRIHYSLNPGGLEELRNRVLETINRCIAAAAGDAGVDDREICCAAVSGNTTMIHLLLGLDPDNIRREPFTPTVLDVPVYRAADIGVGIHRCAPVVISPAVGSYVGGDITAGVLCSSLVSSHDRMSLYLDIGTNGEIVVGNKDFLMSCACSAGPAFEGGGISCGMRASDGAVERVELDAQSGVAEVFTIGNTRPSGICGSGMISLLAGLLRTGWIDRAGRFARGRECPRLNLTGRRARYTLVPALNSATGSEIVIHENDIENILRAKAAIYAACSLLIKQLEAGFEDLERIYIAGGFGRWLDLEDAITIGLLPDCARAKFHFLGNASLTGTCMALVSERHRKLQGETAHRMTYIELSTDQSYMEQYTAALFLPHTDLSLFSSIVNI